MTYLKSLPFAMAQEWSASLLFLGAMAMTMFVGLGL